MFDILALILLSVFVPLIILVGTKLYNYKNYQKLIKVFAIILFAVDLFRFFYNARFYAKATTPVADLKFSYLAVYSIMMLIATFNNGKLGNFFKKAVVLTSLMPIVLGIFNPTIYTSALDGYAVLKACYFVESGLSVALAILICKSGSVKIGLKNTIWGALVACGYALINFLSIYFWATNYTINLMWYMQMLACIASVFVVYLVYYLISKKTNKAENSVNE